MDLLLLKKVWLADGAPSAVRSPPERPGELPGIHAARLSIRYPGASIDWLLPDEPESTIAVVSGQRHTQSLRHFDWPPLRTNF